MNDSGTLDRARRRRARGAIAALWLLVGVPGLARADEPLRGDNADRVLQSVVVERNEKGWLFVLHLAVPLRYVRHTPRGRAELAVIEMQAIGLERAAGGQPLGREALRSFQGPGGSPLAEVATSPAPPSGRVIEIRFETETVFEVSQASDLRALEISVSARGDPAQEARANAWLAAGANALAEGDNERAAQIFTKVLSLAAPEAHPEAQEMLGLARERAGQRSHARAEYAVFLERFPEHPNAPRVRQRMQAIATAGSDAARHRIVVSDENPMELDFGGRLSSYYSRAEVHLSDGLGSDVADSSWINDLYLTGRVRNRDFEIEASAAGRARFDFEDGPVGSDSRLNALLVEAEQRGDGFWGALGRQRGGGGVTGRFDGGRIGYRPNDRLDFQVLGGFPLKTYASDSLNTDRFQVGAVGQVLEVGSLFDLEVYSNYQNEDDLTYRAALGAQLRHLRQGRSIVASLDYDAYFNAVNIAMLLADIEVISGLNVNVLAEHRKSPILTLGNALIGQSAGSITDLHDAFSASQMKDLARDRTADATTFTLGTRYAIGDRFDVSGNFTASRLSGTDGSGGVLETRSPGYEYTYYAQVAGRALLMDRGVSTVGFRMFDGDQRDGYMLQLNGRYPILSDVRLNPILRLEYIDAEDDSVRFVPRLRFDYSWRAVVFDFDVAFDWVRRLGSGNQPDEYGYSLLVGLRYDF